MFNFFEDFGSTVKLGSLTEKGEPKGISIRNVSEEFFVFEMRRAHFEKEFGATGGNVTISGLTVKVSFREVLTGKPGEENILVFKKCSLDDIFQSHFSANYSINFDRYRSFIKSTSRNYCFSFFFSSISGR
jgi:hypothetical protein